MTKDERNSVTAWFEEYVDLFRGRDGTLPPALELKREHSLRVAHNARLISETLNMPERERYLAESAGLVHDVGRFLQFKNYGSFRDVDTVDHGAEGRRVLEAHAHSSILDPEERTTLYCAVAFHNRNQKDIPQDLTEGQRRLLHLIRDADKLDILELVLNSLDADGFLELPQMLPHIRLDGTASPAVLDEALTTRSVSMGALSSLADFLVMLATWFYDLNYGPSRELAYQRNIFPRLRQKLPDEDGINKLFSDIDEFTSTSRKEWVHNTN